MTIAQQLLAELEQEAIATRKILKAIPMEKSEWAPHKKSMTLGRLATHVAEIPGWFEVTLLQDVLDFATSAYKPHVAATAVELMDILEKNLKKTADILTSFPDKKMSEDWTMRSGDIIFFTLPKGQAVRTWCLNHWYHHRAQLGVYLRLLDIPVPSTYGPTADES